MFVLVLAFAALGCGDRKGNDSSTSSTTGSSGTGEEGPEPDMGGETGQVECDVPGPSGSCSVWCQDCPSGEKCTATYGGGGPPQDVWKQTACVPVVDDAQPAGSECDADYANFEDGIDTCSADTFCWNIQSSSGIGTCMPLCTGSPDEPECPAGKRCMRHPSFGQVAVCMEMCDPLESPKIGEYTCSPSDPECFPPTCFPLGDRGGLFYMYVYPESPGVGEPCTSLGCQPGLLCAPADATVGCEGAGCCVPYCDLDNPSCADGTECISVFEPGAAMENVEHVGACVAK